MTENPATVNQPETAEPRWRPLSAIERRVVGVLVEKAKTTPDGYPMSLKAICTASNQKSNRAPLMNLEPDDVEEALDRLRDLGAVGMIEGYGRVSKYRHYLYDWLGVDKVELAVMAELLLRGAQTVGELRGRAARMEPIADLAALRPVLDSLKAKKLVVALTPEGRGHVVTHGLYRPEELKKVEAQYAQGRGGHPGSSPGGPIPTNGPVVSPSPEAPGAGEAETLRRELDEIRSHVVQLKNDLEDLRVQNDRIHDELRELKDALGA